MIFKMWLKMDSKKHEKANSIGKQILQLIKNSNVNYPVQVKTKDSIDNKGLTDSTSNVSDISRASLI